VIDVTVEVGLLLFLEDSLQCRQLRNLLGVEVCRLVEHQSVTVSKDIGREPSVQSEVAHLEDWRESRLHQCLTGLEILAGDGHTGLLGQFPHGGNVYRGVRCAHDKGASLGERCVCITHARCHMLAVIILHGLLERGDGAVEFLLIGHIDLCRRSPNHHHAVHAGLLFELDDIIPQSFHHFPTGLAVLHVVAIKTLGIVLVKSGFQRHNLLQFVAHRLYVLGLEHFSINRCLISVLRIHVPCTENDILQLCQWYDILIMEIFLLFSLTHTDLVILSHRPHRFGQSFAGHQHTGHKRCSHGAASDDHDSKFAFSRLYVCHYSYV